MKRLAILDDYQRVSLKLGPWEQLADHVEISVFHERFQDKESVVVALAEFEIVLLNRERTPFQAEVIEALPKLELIVTFGMINAAIDIEFAKQRGIPVCGTKTLGHPVVELTWALILGFVRHIPTEVRTMQEGGWQSTLGMDLRGKTLGVIGFGRIGSAVARVGTAFGMEVLGWSPSLTMERTDAVGARLATWDELVQQGDVISVHIPLKDATRHLIDEAVFREMKSNSLLVNTSRGPIVDETAMLAALSNGEIGGAALDVYDREPLPSEHPLRRLSNVLLTPHLGYVSEQNYRTCFEQAVENIIAWLKGAPIRLLGGSEKKK